MLQKASNCFHDALANGHPESSPLSVLDVLPFDDSPNCQTPFSGCSTIRTLQKQNLCGEPMAGRPGLGSSRLGRSSWNTSPSLRLHQLQFSPCRHRNRVETRTAPGDFSRSSSLSDPKVRFVKEPHSLLQSQTKCSDCKGMAYFLLTIGMFMFLNSLFVVATVGSTGYEPQEDSKPYLTRPFWI